MKFQKFSAFENHFRESCEGHLCPVYIVVCPRENERKKILSDLEFLLKSLADFKRCDQIGEALDHLRCGSLFSERRAALLSGLDHLLRGELDLLLNYVTSPSPKSCLLLGSSRMQEASALYKEGKNALVILDLSKEKPWEERERLQRWAGELLAAEKKRIAADAMQALLDRLGPDRILIEQELNKLLCFTLGRNAIELSDVQAICSERVESNVYAIARACVWKEGSCLPLISDAATALQLASALRHQLEMGLKMCALLSRGASRPEIVKAFPRLYPKNLNECLEGARRKKAPFFTGRLLALFELEYGLKSSLARPDILFAKFSAATT